MKIDFRTNRDDPQFLTILLEDLPWKEVSKKLFARYLRDLQSCQTSEKLKKLFFELEEKVARIYAYKLLTYRGLFSFQLENKLKEKKISHKTIQIILNQCLRFGYIDDEREFRLYVERENKKGRGPYYIAGKCRFHLRGLPDRFKEQLFSLISPESERSQIKEIVRKRYAGHNLNDVYEKQKVFAFLKRRGFTLELIREILNQIS